MNDESQKPVRTFGDFWRCWKKKQEERFIYNSEDHPALQADKKEKKK